MKVSYRQRLCRHSEVKGDGSVAGVFEASVLNDINYRLAPPPASTVVAVNNRRWVHDVGDLSDLIPDLKP